MICEKCGFETGPTAKFCMVCGTPVTPVQMPEPDPQVEDEAVLEEISAVFADAIPAEPDVFEDVQADVFVNAEPDVFVNAEPEENAESAGEETLNFEPEPFEVPVYNSEMAVPAEPEQEDAFVINEEEQLNTLDDQNEEVCQTNVPEAPAAQVPPAVVAENIPENAYIPPVYPGVPMYGVPTGQTYNGIPVYAMPNVPVYNVAPNAQAYNAAPNAQAYNAAPNAQTYNGAPVYPPFYAAPGYGAPVQAYPGGPVYAAPAAPGYAPQGAPMYAPAGFYGAEPVKEKPKTVSILALLGSIAAIVALFLSLVGDTEVSVFKILTETLPDIFDSLEYIDRFTTLHYLVLAATVICVLCTLCAVLVFIFACLKKKCRGTAVFGMLLIIGLVALFFAIGLEVYGRYVEVDFDAVVEMVKGLGIGTWLYLGGMFVAVIGGGKR